MEISKSFSFFSVLIILIPKSDANPLLERYSSLKPFAKKMFAVSPLLCQRIGEFDALWAEFMSYKTSISTYGTVLLNQDCTKIVLCQNYKGTSWTIPSGKVNQGETGIQAGARETYEETGFDPEGQRGVARQLKQAAQEKATEQGIPWDSNNNDIFEKMLGWNPLRECDKLINVEEGTGKQRTCYICRGVPETFPFEPVARKEVSLISWHDLNNLPKKTYSVLPFLRDLKRWIKKRQNDQEIFSPKSFPIVDEGGGFKELQPFFSFNGHSPWDDVVSDDKAIAATSLKLEINESIRDRIDNFDDSPDENIIARPGNATVQETHLSKTDTIEGEHLYRPSTLNESSPSPITLQDGCFEVPIQPFNTALVASPSVDKLNNKESDLDDLEWMKRWVEGLRPRQQSSSTLFQLDIASVMEVLYG